MMALFLRFGLKIHFLGIRETGWNQAVQTRNGKCRVDMPFVTKGSSDDDYAREPPHAPWGLHRLRVNQLHVLIVNGLIFLRGRI